VTEVLDGDSIVVSLGSRSEEVKLLGVDAPEHDECFFKQAFTFTKKRLDGKQVALRFDRSHHQSDGTRLFAYVHVERRPVNIDLVQRGYARERSYGPAYQMRDSFLDVQTEAWRDRRGLWGACANTELRSPPS
jgi:micrococcal nuclease